jgi:hypothetical protein
LPTDLSTGNGDAFGVAIATSALQRLARIG